MVGWQGGLKERLGSLEWRVQDAGDNRGGTLAGAGTFAIAQLMQGALGGIALRLMLHRILPQRGQRIGKGGRSGGLLNQLRDNGRRWWMRMILLRLASTTKATTKVTAKTPTKTNIQQVNQAGIGYADQPFSNLVGQRVDAIGHHAGYARQCQL